MKPLEGDYEYCQMMAFDSQEILSGKTTYNFFEDDTDRNGESAGKIVEQELIKWFFHLPGSARLLYRELELNNICNGFTTYREKCI